MSNETPDEVSTLIDHEAIRSVIYRYGRGIDTSDYDLVLSVFDDPCSLVFEPIGANPVVFDGREEVDAFYRSREGKNSSLRLLRHVYSNSSITVNGDVADSVVYWDESREFDNRVLQSGGLYLDRLRRTERGWRIRERIIRLEFSWTLFDNVKRAESESSLKLRGT